MQQIFFQSKNKLTPRRNRWRIILIGLALLIILGLMVNFFENLHYGNLILQANDQTSTAQAELSKEQYNVQYLINNASGQINCYNLRSNYARNLCNTHNDFPGHTN